MLEICELDDFYFALIFSNFFNQILKIDSTE